MNWDCVPWFKWIGNSGNQTRDLLVIRSWNRPLNLSSYLWRNVGKFCLSPGNGASRILTFIVVTFSSRNFSMFQCWTFLFRNSFCSLGIEAFVNLLQRLQLSNAQESIKKILKLYGSFQRLRNLIKTIRKLNAKSLILSSPLPWY